MKSPYFTDDMIFCEENLKKKLTSPGINVGLLLVLISELVILVILSGVLGLTRCCPWDSQRVFSSIIEKHQFFSTQFFLMFQLSYPYMATGKTIALITQIFVSAF